MAFLCVSQQGEFKNTIQNVLGKSMSKTFFAKKVEDFFPLCFWPFLCMTSSKTP
jgi:hypothetical protein